jgi:nitrate/nitrite transporter NarK
MLADRFGGRLVFSSLMLLVSAPAFFTPMARSYEQLLLGGFFLGLAGSSFAVGVGFVSRWFSAEQQGSALGAYGLGNIGQSAAVFLGPLLAVSLGWQSIFRGMAVALAIWAIVFWIFARNAPVSVRPNGIGEMLAFLARERLSWALSAFYFLTFGGFVAFSIYLPSLLRDQFHLAPADAGFRTAGFVVLATLLRPVGGWLSDRIGGARVLSVVFAVVIPFALLLAWPSMLPFTIGALGCAALMGLGNGAVFKLVPQYFPGHGRTRRFLPAASARFLPRSNGRRLAGLCLTRDPLSGDVACERACVHSPAGGAGACASSANDPRRGPRSGRHMGDAGYPHPGGCHRRRVAQSAGLRPGPGDLHVRHRFRHMGRRLSLQCLAG